VKLWDKLFGKKDKPTEHEDQPVSEPSPVPQNGDGSVIRAQDLYSKEEWQQMQRDEANYERAMQLAAANSQKERMRMTKNFWNSEPGRLIIECHIEEDQPK
jgi:hypothetical protein